jgi:hypothetical protein
LQTGRFTIKSPWLISPVDMLLASVSVIIPLTLNLVDSFDYKGELLDLLEQVKRLIS